MEGRERRSPAPNEAISLVTLPATNRRRKNRRRFGRISLAFLLAVSAELLVGGDLYGDMTGTYSKKIQQEKYGNIYLSRKCVSAGQKSVLFSHWTHRTIFACRVCHFEVGFPMEVNGIDITMELNRSGKFCGFCHDGKEVFGTTDADCQKCHHGFREFDYGEKIDRLSWLPESLYGNKVDWSAALEEGVIHPIFCFDKETCKVFDMMPPVEIEMASESDEVPPVLFLHSQHSYWLDCLNCHPGSLVNRSGKVGFPDQGRNRRKFCKGCHKRIAFPMDNCERCHPGMDNDW
jgi:c(7)-type cytochrome triheme protein